MAKQKYSYGQAPTDTTKKVAPKITKTVYETKMVDRRSQDQKERDKAMAPESNEQKLKRYGLDNSQSSEGTKRMDKTKFSVTTVKPKLELDSTKYEKSIAQRKTGK